MNILVIGSGGREHALVWKISQSKMVSKLYCAPGNPGIGALAELVPLSPQDISGLAAFAKEKQIGLTVVGPEQPLAEGLVDAFKHAGLLVFGPTKAAAELEWSKAFAKEFMARHRIPTASHHTFRIDQIEAAETFLKHCPVPIVIKADGLAAGKGVVICQNHPEALGALHEMVDTRIFGGAGTTVVIEEFMEGEEASIFAVTDGKDFVTLAAAQDHKRIFDGDRGKNTGGMGAYAPAPLVTPEILRDVENRIIRPTLEGMAAEGRPYCGCLYVGLMLTSKGPKVVEFNVRFGDPEAQVVLPLYEGDLVELLVAAAKGEIAHLPEKHEGTRGAAVCVVLASRGYPDPYPIGVPIHGLTALRDRHDVVVFHAGTKLLRDQIVTSGGRVIGVTAVRPKLPDAITLAYDALASISFDGMQFRHDIGKKALVHQSTEVR